jgi:CBS domain-containing protein
MRIREVMTHAPVTVNSDEPVTTAARAMKEHDVGAISRDLALTQDERSALAEVPAAPPNV